MSNTQGAPTTGLGQNVTFVGDPVTGAPLSSRLDQAELQLNSGATRQSLAIQPRGADFRENNAIAEMTSDFGKAISKKLQEKDQESFLNGMMDAAQGKAVEEIAAEQPWYSNLFGPSGAELGAKAFEAQDRVNRKVAEIQAQLPDMAHLDYGTAKAQVASAMNGLLTGDEGTDAVVRNGFFRAVPHLVAQHTKLRVEYVNKTALTNQSRMRRSAFDVIETNRAAVARGQMTQEEFDQLANNQLADTFPTAGQNPAMWEEVFVQDTIAAAQKGQLTSVRAALANGRDKLLDPANLDRVRLAEKRGNSTLRSQWLDENADTLAQLEYNIQHAVGGTVAENFKKLMDYSEAGKREVGATEDLYDRSKAMALVKGGLAAVQSEYARKAREVATAERKAATAAAKEAAAQDKASLVDSMWARGDAFAVKQLVTDEEVETRGFNEYAVFTQRQDLQGAAKFLSKFDAGRGFTFNRVASQLQAQAKGAIQAMGKGGITDAGLQQLYAPWKALNDAGVSTQYFGEALDGKLLRLHRMFSASGSDDIEKNRASLAIAFEDAFVRQDVVTLKEDDAKALDGGFFSGGNAAWNELPKEARATALSFLDIKSYPTAREGVERTLPTALKTGQLEVFGKTVVWNGKATPVKTFLRDPKLSKESAERWGLGTFESDDEATQAAFNKAVELKTYGYRGATNEKSFGGLVPSTVTIQSSRVIRIDDAGKPRLVIWQVGDDNKAYPVTVSMDDMYAARAFNYHLKNGGLYGKRAVDSKSLFDKAQQQLTKQ